MLFIKVTSRINTEKLFSNQDVEVAGYTLGGQLVSEIDAMAVDKLTSGSIGRPRSAFWPF